MTNAAEQSANVLMSLDVADLYNVLSECRDDGRAVPMIYGRAGIGKSEIVYQWASDNGYVVQEERLGYRVSEQIGAVPAADVPNRELIFLVSALIAKVRKLRKSQKKPVLLFLDEGTLAKPDVMAAFLELLNEYAIDGEKLPPDTFVCGAGNLPTHTSAAVYFDIPARSRVLAYVFEPSMASFVAHLERTFAGSPLVRSLAPWLESSEGMSIVDKEHHTEGASPICTRRSLYKAIAWAHKKAEMSKIADAHGMWNAGALLAKGRIGIHPFATIDAHLAISADVPAATDILAAPTTATVPTTTPLMRSALSATVALVKQRGMADSDVLALIRYLDRFEQGFAATWLTGIDERTFTAIKGHPRGAALISETGCTRGNGAAQTAKRRSAA